MNRQALINALHNGIVTVDFTKKDGSHRKMHCTLDAGRIPTFQLPKGTGRVKTDEVVSVYDTDKQDWRSFTFDAVDSYLFAEVK